MITIFASQKSWNLSGAAQELEGLCEVQARVGTLPEVRDSLISSASPVIFFGDYVWDDANIEELTQLKAALPSCSFAVYSPSPTPDQMIALMRIGVREVITDDSADSIAAAFARLMPHLKTAEGPGKKGPKRIGFISAKGGDGATTVVANYATALALAGKKSFLVDLALPFGDCDLQLIEGAAENRLADFVKEVDRLDPRLISAMVSKSHDHLSFIPGPADPEGLGDISPQVLGTLIEKLSVMPGVLLMDLGTATHAGALGLLDSLDQIYLVVRPEVASMRRAGQLLSLFRALEVDVDRVSVILNRSTPRSLVRAADLETATGVRVATELPQSDYVARGGTHYTGTIVVARPKDSFSQAINQWVLGDQPSQSKKKVSLWRR